MSPTKLTFLLIGIFLINVTTTYFISKTNTPDCVTDVTEVLIWQRKIDSLNLLYKKSSQLEQTYIEEYDSLLLIKDSEHIKLVQKIENFKKLEVKRLNQKYKRDEEIIDFTDFTNAKWDSIRNAIYTGQFSTH